MVWIIGPIHAPTGEDRARLRAGISIVYSVGIDPRRLVHRTTRPPDTHPLLEFPVARKTSQKTKVAPTTIHVRRVNWKAFGILGITLVVGLLIYLPAKYLNNRGVRGSVLAQAEQARARGDVDLALRHLDRFLADRPEDIPALEAKANILSEAYLPWGQLLDAANTLDQLIRLSPAGEGRLKTRRKLAELYIRYSDDLKRLANTSTDPDLERQQSRYAAAASIARELLLDATKGNYQDAVAHRLLARAYEGQIGEIRGQAAISSSKRGAEKKEKDKDRDKEEEDLRLKTIKNYKQAIAIDPHDLESPARLASLYSVWMKDEASSDQILDALLKENPNSSEVRLIRFRAFVASNRDALARAELAEVVKLVPEDVDIRIEAATVALNRRDPVEARKQLDAIPVAKQEDLRVKILRGYMEFAEQHPDDAIDQWRRGLLLVGGTNQDLTWRLAFNLVQLGRYSEADPLRQQYARLAKSDKNGMAKFLDALFDMGYGRLYDAREKLEKIKDLVQANIKAEVLLALGRCCEMMGDPEAALLAFRNAATSSPTSAAPRLAIARHLQKRHPDDAILEIDRALADAPKETNLLLESIRLRVIRASSQPTLDPAQRREIEGLLARLEAVAPTSPVLPAYRAEILAMSGELSRAVEILGRSARGDGKKTAEIWITWAQGLDRLNRKPESIQVLDEAALPQNVGDHARIRLAKARLLARAGRGQDAREALAKNMEALSVGEQPEIAKALGDLLRELGDRDGARAAYADWANLAKNIPGPALTLLAMGQTDNDDKAAKLGLETLRKIGGDREPYGLAARALDLMRVDPSRPGIPPADRLFEAELLIKTLRQEVPSLRIGSLLEGMLLEYRGDLAGAVRAYKTAQKDDINSPALTKLIEMYIKLKRFDELDGLKREFYDEAQARQQPNLAAEFDRIATSVALKLGEKDQADYFASKLIDNRRDNVMVRATYARMLDSHNKPDQAEESLRSLVKERPNDPSAWLTLISFLAIRKSPAELAPTIGQARRECGTERPELFAAQCYWLAKDIPNAKAAFKKATDLKPNDLVTLRGLVEFYENTDQLGLIDPILRKVLKIDPSTSWAARALAMRISGRLEPSSWAEAWALVAPGSSTSGDTPEDRLIRATVLARSPESARREEAIRAFIALSNDLPIASRLASDTRVRLAQALLEITRVKEAWDAVRPIADDVSQPNPGALVLAVESLAKLRRPDEAETYLKRLKQLEPKSPQVPLAESWILFSQGKKPEALAALEAAYNESATLPVGETIGLLAVGRSLWYGDTETPLRLAKALVLRSPALAWCLARVHVVRKEYDLALAAAEAGLQAGSARESLRYATAAASLRHDDAAFVAKVASLGESARIKAPKDYNVHVFLGTIRHLQARYEDELACYREALELNPNNVQFLNNMAWTLSEGLNQPDEALNVIQEAIRREGEDPQYLDTRGVIEERLGQLPKAIADLEASAKGQRSATTFFHLSRAYLKANDTTASRRNRDIALQLKFDPATLDPTDRADLSNVMGSP